MNGQDKGVCARCAELLREHDELRVKLETVTLYAQRTTAQLRDEERENGALRRRLREGGR
jgi:hypothetical protein